jgi:arylsulfatase
MRGHSQVGRRAVLKGAAAAVVSAAVPAETRRSSAQEATPQPSSFPVEQPASSYPPPDYSYPNAVIGVSYEDSKPDFPPVTKAPEGAPNILLVLLDDVGFAWLESFGGVVASPTVERLAGTGLRYNAFHTTALCSPTRAALLTGRNHHSVGTGVIEEIASGYPGYSGLIPRSAATIGQLLHYNGYATGWWGKNHNIPDNQLSAFGPFDHWPTSLGFDYFYGFIGGECDQFYPPLYRGTTPVDAPSTPEQGYQLTNDLTDDCISWIKAQTAIAPDQPFFAYFSPGAAHAPHQPPLDWRGRHAGLFDMGWDDYRTQAWQRQLELGVIPPDTKLTERPEQIPAWDASTPEEQRLYTRLVENYADFLGHADSCVGRLIDTIESLGKRDNTLIFYILGDNGSSAEGGLTGTINDMMTLTGVTATIDEVLPYIDEIGLPGTSPHYPIGWAWAGDAPYKWTKQIASHFGGTRNPMVVSWPERIIDDGGLRSQFHHIIDIVPTILEVAGIAQPAMVNGIAQKPIEGTSLAYTFDEANASVPTRHTTQYFEIMGNRAIYSNGWVAACFHGRTPWENGTNPDFNDDVWELYDLSSDWSEAVDLAAANPKKLDDMKELFLIEAAKYNVFPLDDRTVERGQDASLRPSYFTGRDRITLFGGMTRLPEGSAPKLNNVHHAITVDATIPDGGADGVLIALGGDSAGFTLYVKDQRLVYEYNWFNIDRYTVTSTEAIPSGNVKLGFEFVPQAPAPGSPADVSLTVNGAPAGSGVVEKQITARFGTESLDVGRDCMSPVSKNYGPARFYPFTGEIATVEIDFPKGQAELSPEERFRLAIAMA